MHSLWLWLAVAAAGALHGLNPAAGWIFAAWGMRRDGRSAALRALGPIAAGHAASVAVVAAAVPASLRLGMTIDRPVLQGAAAGLLLILAAHHLITRGSHQPMQRAGHAGVALWAFAMGTAHGPGLMLVPALIPLCASDQPAREITASGSMLLAVAAVGVHMAAMLATTAAMAAGGQCAWRRLWNSFGRATSRSSSPWNRGSRW
jgi:hypothetical protein